MFTYYISVGSNVDPQKNIPACIRRLQSTFKDIKISSVYETPPFGPAGDVNFWNLACAIRTSLNAEEIRQKMSQIENEFGRTHDGRDKFAPRTMDIDVLPKEGYQRQAFVIIPVAEIDPNALDPLTNRAFRDLAAELTEEAKSFKKIAVH